MSRAMAVWFAFVAFYIGCQLLRWHSVGWRVVAQ